MRSLLFQIFVIFVLTVGCFGQAGADRQIKLALFSTFDGKECFLSELELERFAGVLGRMKHETKQIRGKFVPQEFVFYYWEYYKPDKRLNRHSVDFNSDGHSINWKMTQEDSRIIVSLIDELLNRTKK